MLDRYVELKLTGARFPHARYWHDGTAHVLEDEAEVADLPTPLLKSLIVRWYQWYQGYAQPYLVYELHRRFQEANLL